MLLGWRDCVRDLDCHEQRCRLRQFLLPSEQDTSRDPIVARYLRQAGSQPRRLLDDPAFIRFAILSLIQRALLPRLMVLAPKNLAVTLTGSKFVGHPVSSLSKFVGENRSRPIREETSVQEMDAYNHSLLLPC